MLVQLVANKPLAIFVRRYANKAKHTRNDSLQDCVPCRLLLDTKCMQIRLHVYTYACIYLCMYAFVLCSIASATHLREHSLRNMAFG